MKWKKRNRWTQITTYQGFHYSLHYDYGSGYYGLISNEVANWDNRIDIELGQLDTLTDAKKQAEKMIHNLTERTVK